MKNIRSLKSLPLPSDWAKKSNIYNPFLPFETMKKGAVIGIVFLLVLLGIGLWYVISANTSQEDTADSLDVVPSSSPYFPSPSEGAPVLDIAPEDLPAEVADETLQEAASDS